MVIEKNKTILPHLTTLSPTSAQRNQELALLKKYANAMEQRQSFYVNKQKNKPDSTKNNTLFSIE